MTEKIAQRANLWELRQLGDAPGSPWGLWRKGYGELAFVRFGPTFATDAEARSWFTAYCKHESNEIARALADQSGHRIERALSRGVLPNPGHA